MDKQVGSRKRDFRGMDKVVISLILAFVSFGVMLVPALSPMEGPRAAISFMTMPFIAIAALIFANKAKDEGCKEGGRGNAQTVARVLSIIALCVGGFMVFPAFAILLGNIF